MVNWEDVENESQGDFLKLAEGKTLIEVVGEPKKGADKWGNVRYKFTVFTNNDNSKTLNWDVSPMLMKAIGSCLKKPATLHGKKFYVLREGLEKENTKYEITPEADKVI